MSIRGVIFDLDGVVVFTDRFHYQAWKKAADRLGVYFDENINNRLRGVSRMKSLEIILENYHGKPLSEQEKEQIAAEKNETYRELLRTMKPEDVTQEVRDTLASLRRMGIRLAIGSSSKNAKLILERVGLTDAFDKISDGTNIVRSKPAPEVFLKAAEFLELTPEDCLVVEDAAAGIDAAVAGGMHSAAIGDAVLCGKAEYQLYALPDLISIVAAS